MIPTDRPPQQFANPVHCVKLANDGLLYVCDRISQCEKLGELRSAVEAGLWKKGPPPELGEVLTGKLPGRDSDDQITICDLTGTGAQDTAIATFAMELARQHGVGAAFVT